MILLLCAVTAHAQIKFVGAGGVGDGTLVPSAGVGAVWKGWNGEIRVGVIEEKTFLLLKLGREVRGITLLSEGRVGGYPYLLTLGGKEFPSPSKESSLFLGGGYLLTNGGWEPAAAMAMSMAVNRKKWKVGTEIIFTFPIEPHLVVKFAVPF
ncbi:MAG: hypothetical protein WC659_05450 [Patescibacteria group bacterium]